jgi:MFS family permease
MTHFRQRGFNRIMGGFAQKTGLWRLRGVFSLKDYLAFLLLHPHLLGFCLLWTAFSGLGQTFFLSLFQPYWMDSLGLSTAKMGLLYGSATLLSASLLGKVGQWVDRVSERKVALLATAGLTLGWVAGALSTHWTLLFIAIALLRFFGQGLSTLLATIRAYSLKFVAEVRTHLKNAQGAKSGAH